jgi:hypothetical protein
MTNEELEHPQHGYLVGHKIGWLRAANGESRSISLLMLGKLLGIDPEDSSSWLNGTEPCVIGYQAGWADWEAENRYADGVRAAG